MCSDLWINRGLSVSGLIIPNEWGLAKWYENYKHLKKKNRALLLKIVLEFPASLKVKCIAHSKWKDAYPCISLSLGYTGHRAADKL